MIATSFAYERATSVADAIRLLGEAGGDGKLLAGGHSLLPLMKLRLTSPVKLIDIGGIKELTSIKTRPGELSIGALCTHRQLAMDPLVTAHVPLLADAVRRVGDLQVRNRGTIGGNLAHADPSSDLPAVVLACEAQMELSGPDGETRVAANDFFLGPLLSILGNDQILTGIAFPTLPDGHRATYVKFAHPASGYAVVGVAAMIAADANGTVTYARIALNGAADTPYRARAAEKALLGERMSADTVRRAAEHVTDRVDIAGDIYASADYRAHLARVYAERALTALL